MALGLGNELLGKCWQSEQEQNTPGDFRLEVAGEGLKDSDTYFTETVGQGILVMQ